MARDLELIVITDTDATCAYGSTVLEVDTDRDLFNVIGHMYDSDGSDEAPEKEIQIPGPHILAKSDCIGGSLTAGQLAGLAGHQGVTESVSNRAAWAYLAALDLGTRIVLLWSY